MIRIAIVILTILSFQTYGQIEKDANTIYSLILNEELKHDSVDYKKIIIQSKTSTQHAAASIEALCGFVKMNQPIFCSYPGNINEVISKNPEVKDLLLDLDKVKDKKTNLANGLTVTTTYQLLDPKDFFDMFKKSADEGWQQIRTENPGLFGVVEFSAIVVRGDFATVYFGYQRDAFHGSGSIIVLKREAGQWKIISRPEVWVS